MGTFMSKHNSNLLNYNAVDDKGSALLNAGHGGKGHPHPNQKDVKTPRKEKRSSFNPFNPMYSGVFQGTNPFIKTSKGNISEHHGLDVETTPKPKPKVKR